MKNLTFPKVSMSVTALALLAVFSVVGCTPPGGDPDTTPPAVSSTMPTNNATGVSINPTIIAFFSYGGMDDATITASTFTLDNGVTGTVNYDDGYAPYATFTPTSSLAYSTTYTATITTGVKDKAGNAMAAPYTWTFTTTAPPDTTAPTVSSTSPASGATGVAINTAITATFSETMDAATITNATFTIAGVTGAVTYTGTTATFTPTSSLAYSTTYTATITTAVKDAAGNAMAANYVWTFSTAPDTTAPIVSSTNPASGATGVAVNTAITASFSETMDAATITAATFTIGGATGTVTYDAINMIAQFTPTSSLAYSTTYTATITTGVKDAAGNAMAANYTWTFTTGTTSDTTAPTVSSTSPVSSAAGVAINSAITATFSEAMDAATITNGTFTIAGVTGAVTYSGTTATFTPSSSLGYSTTYTATITKAVKDAADNAIAAPYTWTFTTTAAVPGSLDTTFNTTGKVTTAIGTNHDYAQAVAIQSDGKIVAAGYSWNDTNDFTLVRYNTDGSLDTTFNTTGKVTTAIGTGTDWAYAVAIQSDGKIVAAGHSWNGTNDDFALVRYNTDGSLDATFNTTGKVTTDFVGTGGWSSDIANAVAIQSDGKIVAAGYSYNSFDSDFAVVRYNTDGSLDTSFGTTGKVTTAIGTNWDRAYAVAIQSDGKIVAAGYSVNNAYDDFALVRYNTDGSLDTTFNTTGKVTTDFVGTGGGSSEIANAVAIQSDGKIVAAGYSDTGAYNNAFALVRYNTDGSLDTSFNTTGKVITAIGTGYDSANANAVAIQSDGKIVAAGHSYNGFDSDFAVVRYNTDGSLDTSFGTTGKVTTAIGTGRDWAYAVAIQSDGKIVAAGYSDTGTYDDFAVVRYWP